VARKDRLPPDIEWFLEVAPVLAIEIVSPSNSAGSIEREIAIDPAAGVPAVWIVYLNERSIVVHPPDKAPQVYRDGETLPGEDLLPGFSLPVVKVFD
jgi:Uma2 family endonuclease